MRLESIKAEFQTGLPLKLYGFVQNYNWKNHIVSDFCVYPHVYIPFRTSPLVFLRHVLKLQQDAGCASKPAPKTEEVMEDDSDEELTGPVVGNVSGFFQIFQDRIILKFLRFRGILRISKRFGFLL